MYGISHTEIVFKLQLLDLPEKIVTQLLASSQICYMSNENKEEIVTRVTNLTEGHCRYIYQLCNRAEIEKLFDSVYEDFIP